MAKRVPPSQRAERKMDETAKAIAQAREEAKPEKPTSAERSSRDEAFAHGGAAGKGAANLRRPTGPVANASSKRPKSGES